MAGAVMPKTQSVEAAMVIDAEVEDVADYLSDLETWPDWLGQIPRDAAPVFGETVGEGASLAWQSADSLGSVDLVQVTDDLIRASVMSEGEERMITLVLGPEARGTTILMKQDRTLGGFPYLDRVRAQMGRGAELRRIDASLQGLAAQLSG